MKKRIVHLCAALFTGSLLSACYVVPATPGTRVVQTPNMSPAPIQAQATILHAKLYPTNAAAQRYGTVQATVTTEQNGHGSFRAFIGGENFSGDATRQPGSRNGRANGSSGNGRYIACEYEMNSAKLGSGTCRLSDGALFPMHIHI